jgi:uncharacterized SAM-binding protein YcdF (DUF218 family)
MSKCAFLISLCGALLVGLWFYGFLGFVAAVDALPEQIIEPSLDKTDAIIVLTGGSERVATGIELLESGTGKKLFISGVHKKLSLEGILGNQPVSPSLRACCIILGYQAGSTFGNAEETREWMTIEGYHSLRLVTANYHMPRSLLLFHAAMPDVTIIPHPIAPDSVKLYTWWQHPHTIELLVVEYIKFLLANIKTEISG